jgi:ribosomal protein L24
LAERDARESRVGRKMLANLSAAAGSVQPRGLRRARIRCGDVVVVIAGADKGKVGKVLRVFTDKERVVVEGVNRVWKHVRPSQQNPQGGRVQRDAPIRLRDVAVVDAQAGQTLGRVTARTP